MATRPPVHGKQTTKKQSKAASAKKNGGRSKRRAAGPPPVDVDLSAALSNDQQQVMDAARAGQSFFFTGSAGTGKSFLIKRITVALRETHPNGVFATASTGIAACGICGRTIHSFAGIGLGTEDKETLLERISFPARMRWRSCRVLIIDEISLISADIFDKLEYIARRIKNNSAPFGGIQIILCGDFYQLPPIVSSSSSSGSADGGGGGGNKLCFEAGAWGAVVQRGYRLSTMFRQRDAEFIGMLEEIRSGVPTEATLHRLDECRGRPASTLSVKLYPHRDTVDQTNLAMLATLPGESVTYRAMDDGEPRLLDVCQYPETLELKPGAQVVLLKNIDFERHLVNGSIGIIAALGPLTVTVDFGAGRLAPLGACLWESVDGTASRTQIPVKLAWALSIHKCQGMTLSSIEVNLERVFEAGQAYVALSRCTSFDGIRLVGSLPAHIFRSPSQKIADFYLSLTTLPR